MSKQEQFGQSLLQITLLEYNVTDFVLLTIFILFFCPKNYSTPIGHFKAYLKNKKVKIAQIKEPINTSIPILQPAINELAQQTSPQNKA